MMAVDDEAATRELVGRGAGRDGDPSQGERLRYRHLRAPDGRVFELIARRV